MAAKETTTTSQILTETAAINLTILRSVANPPTAMPGSDLTNSTPLVSTYNINMAYGDNEYMLDASGNKVRLLSQNQNQGWINFNPAQVASFFTTQITPAGASTPVNLGDYLGSLMDAAIQADITAKAAAPAAPVTSLAAPMTGIAAYDPSPK